MPTLDPASAARLADLLNRPLTVGGRTVANRLWLSPMAGVGNVAFRQVLSGYGGCGLLFTEMCGAKSVPTENPGASTVFTWHPEELPRLVCQIAGREPRDVARAARRVEDEGFFGVDINMSCSVSGIVKKGAGAALLREPGAALAVVEAVRAEVDIPVFIKFRTGWSPDVAPAVELARRFEDAGADCLVFHPRVAPDKRTRPVVPGHIRAVAEAVSIPVLGNGDVILPGDCLSMLEETGCAGVSVGRMAVARPWLFAEWTRGFEPEPTVFRDYALALADALERRFTPTAALKRFKLFTIYFAANFTFGHRLQSHFLASHSMDQVRRAVLDHIDPGLQLVARPNLNMYNK